jgi:GNAT superfamily N-acetyltransferase
VLPIVPLHPAADPALAAALAALQRRAYAVEERLIGHPVPAAAESPADLAAAGLDWSGHAHGAIAVRPGAAVLDVERLVVDPAHARRGIGRALVEHVLAAAAGRRVTVATGRDNAPARALYAGLGFVETGEQEVVPGLWITRYARG